MTSLDRYRYWITYSKFISSRETTWTPAINRVLRQQIAPSINLVKQQGIEAALRHIQSTHPDLQNLATTIKNIYTDAGRVFGGMAYQSVKKQAEAMVKKKMQFALQNDPLYFFSSGKDLAEAGIIQDLTSGGITTQIKGLLPVGWNEELVNDIIAYYRLYLLNKAVLPITETTRDYILQTLIHAQRESWSIQQVVNQLSDTDITRNRARLIARTESMRSANWSAVWGAKRTGYQTQKLWISALDNRTRRLPRDQFDHRSMNGQLVEMDEAFKVPKKTGGYENMMQPGDANGSAGDVCRCRCVVAFHIKRDYAGRPLRN